MESHILTLHPDAAKAETKGTYRYVSDDVMGPTSGFYLSKVFAKLQGHELQAGPPAKIEITVRIVG